MNDKHIFRRPALTALVLAMAAPMAHADERESLETLRQTTRNLIDALVDGGVLSREKADALLKSAQQQVTPEAAPKPNTTAEGKPVLRVPYVPESMRNQIRNEVKEEVLATARQERWGVPNATTSWAERIKIDGDIRYRHQSDRPDSSNTLGDIYLAAESSNSNGLTRAPDFGAYAVTASKSFYSTASTTDARSRERLRMRLGMTAKVADEVGVGIRLATGSATDRVSTNQTLGQGFNKYQLFVDRAFIRVDPAEWVTVQGGRIPNPWFSTEMVWSDNLNFEGLAATFRYAPPDASFVPFFTAGWFPLREDTPPGRDSQALVGAQLGASWDFSPQTKLKFGAAMYNYRNIEGRSDNDYELVNIGSGSSSEIAVVSRNRYGKYEYSKSLRQKGNTLFETNPLVTGVDTAPIWGLAYKFQPMVLTASAQFTHFNPFNILLSAEYVNNMAFDQADFRRRATDSAFAGVNPGGKRDGYQLKLGLGATEVREPNDWQWVATYRRVGSDAVLDAFTDSDLGLGGTNIRGYTLGLNYGLYRNTSASVRYLSAENIDTTINDAYPKAVYKVNSLQVDFNVRF